ncbi:unnamed protein product, partial [marine sediment metagenome]
AGRRRFMAVATEPGAGRKHPSAPALIRMGLKRWASVRTLRATFARRERLRGKKKLGARQVIFLRERKKPFSIYMQWLDGPGKNRRIAYIEGRNNGKFEATAGGALGWIVRNMAPDDPAVFKTSRHTILEAGLGVLMRKIDKQFRAAGRYARSKYKGKVDFHGRTCHKFYRYVPQRPGRYCWKLEVLIDEELGFPLYVKFWDWQGEAFEEYSYTDIELNPGYTDKDFHVKAVPRKQRRPRRAGSNVRSTGT